MAHHEPLLLANAAGLMVDMMTIARLVDPVLEQHVAASTTVTHLLSHRP